MSLNFVQILEKARGQWPYILESAGINLLHLKNKHGACPICGGKDRFRFDDKEGRGTYICNQCGAGDGIKLLQLYRECGFGEAIHFVKRILNNNPEPMDGILKRNKLNTNPEELSKSSEARRHSLNAVLSRLKLITHGDPVDRYLRARGIRLDSFSRALRYHPSLPYYHDGHMIGKFPAMVALIQDSENRTVTLHRTYLGNDCKANVPKPKKIMSPVVKGSISGGAIRLYPPTEDGSLTVAEGIETALALHVASGFPVWATVSALGMERIILPPEINSVWIAVDNDHSGTGQKAAAKLASRLILNSQRVRCIMPPNVGDDFADLLLEDKE